jgi:hypothetical protein
MLRYLCSESNWGNKVIYSLPAVLSFHIRKCKEKLLKRIVYGRVLLEHKRKFCLWESSVGTQEEVLFMGEFCRNTRGTSVYGDWKCHSEILTNHGIRAVMNQVMEDPV